jgi:hypothetical protein
MGTGFVVKQPCAYFVGCVLQVKRTGCPAGQQLPKAAVVVLVDVL